MPQSPALVQGTWTSQTCSICIPGSQKSCVQQAFLPPLPGWVLLPVTPRSTCVWLPLIFSASKSLGMNFLSESFIFICSRIRLDKQFTKSRLVNDTSLIFRCRRSFVSSDSARVSLQCQYWTVMPATEETKTGYLLHGQLGQLSENLSQ